MKNHPIYNIELVSIILLRKGEITIATTKYILNKSKKSIRIFFYTILFVLFCFGFSSYIGNKLIYFGFSIISIYSIFFAFRKKALFFETFLFFLLNFYFQEVLK